MDKSGCIGLMSLYLWIILGAFVNSLSCSSANGWYTYSNLPNHVSVLLKLFRAILRLPNGGMCLQGPEMS